MTAQPETESSRGRIRQVGKVSVNVTITNRLDEGIAEQGLRPSSAIRRLILRHVLVDTGANLLCLPRTLIADLGLTHLETVRVVTATGESETDLYQDAKITIMGRSGSFDCLALPDGSQPLLGVLPLERLGLELDLQNETLHALPSAGPHGYMTIL